MFKVGDKVVDVSSGYIKNDGSKVTTGAVYRVLSDGDVMVSFDDTYGVWLCRKGEVEPATIGKTLTELDVKPGDVVRCVNGEFDSFGDFTCTEIVPDEPFKGEHKMVGELYGPGIFGDNNGKWVIIPRAPQPTADEPAEPKRMHPDDVAKAIMEYARDCGYEVAGIDIRSERGTYTYSF